jgi:hypothetical protein
MSKMKSIRDWKARWEAAERAGIARQLAYGRMTGEQREAAVAHLQEIQPGRTNVFWATEIVEAHIERGMGAK